MPRCFGPTTWLVFSVLEPSSMRCIRWLKGPYASSSRVKKANLSMAALRLPTSASPSGPAWARARNGRELARLDLGHLARLTAGACCTLPFLRYWHSSLRRAEVTPTPARAAPDRLVSRAVRQWRPGHGPDVPRPVPELDHEVRGRARPMPLLASIRRSHWAPIGAPLDARLVSAEQQHRQLPHHGVDASPKVLAARPHQKCASAV
jgi:hypothetical protein